MLVAAGTLPIWAMSPQDFEKFGRSKFEVTMLVAILAGVLIVLEAIRQRGFGFRSDTFLWGVALLGAISVLSSMTSSDPVVAVNGNQIRHDGLLVMLANTLLFLAAYRVREHTLVRRVCAALVVGAVPVWGYALVQSVGLDPVVWESFRGAWGRAFSTLGNPIFLGAYSVMVIGLAVGLWMETKTRSGVWWALVAGVGVAVVAMTAARAAWIVLGLGLLLFAVQAVSSHRSRRFAVGFVVSAVTAALFAGGAIALAPPDRVETLESSAASLPQVTGSRNEGRLAIWKISLHMIRDHPLLGIGPDMMGVYFDQYRTPQYDASEGADWYADKPHSSILEWGVETGIPGAATFSALVVAILFVSATTLRRRAREPARSVGSWVYAGAWVGAFSYMAQSVLTVSAIGVDAVWWIMLGLLAGHGACGPSLREAAADLELACPGGHDSHNNPDASDASRVPGASGRE
ncbi:MAG: O-antigen ligase family protein [Thermoleophilia bacterium]